MAFSSSHIHSKNTLDVVNINTPKKINIKIIKNRINDFFDQSDKYKRDDVPATTLAEQRNQREINVNGAINTVTPKCFEVDGVQFCPTNNE